MIARSRSHALDLVSVSPSAPGLSWGSFQPFLGRLT